MADLIVIAESGTFDAGDDRWLRQVADLHRALRADVDGFRFERVEPPGPAKKGAVDAAVLALGSAGAISAAVTCFKAWLGRDKSREIVVRWTDGAVERELRLKGDQIDADTMRRLGEAALKR